MNTVASVPAARSVTVQMIPCQFSAFRLPAATGSNREGHKYLKDEQGLDCALFNDGIVFFPAVNILNPGDIVVYKDRKIIEVLTEEQFKQKYEYLQGT